MSEKRDAELRDERTSGADGGQAPARATGKVQKGSGKDATSRLEEDSKLEGAEGKQRVLVNPALRGDAAIPYEEDGELKQETFEAGLVHYVDAETAGLKFNGVDLFVDAPEDRE